MLDDAGWTFNRIANLLGIKWESVQRVVRKGVPKEDLEKFIDTIIGKTCNDEKVSTLNGVRVTGPKTRAARNRRAR
jgi:hypothetical protein